MFESVDPWYNNHGDVMENRLVILYGLDTYRIKQRTIHYLEKSQIDEADTQVFDLDEWNVDELVNASMTIPFFSDKKAVVGLNAFFLAGQKGAKDTFHDVDYLYRYFASPSESTLLILQVPGDKLSIPKPIMALLDLNAEVEKFDISNKYDLYEIARVLFQKEQLSITPDALEELVNRSDESAILMEKEIEKISTYAMGSSVITIDMIQTLTPKNLEDNVFELVNQLVSRNIKQGLRMLADLSKMNVDPTVILSALANKFLEIAHAKALLKQKTSQEEMMKYFGYSKGRMYYVQKNANEVPMELLTKCINDLEQIDYKIKSGQMDKKLALELFILGL